MADRSASKPRPHCQGEHEGKIVLNLEFLALHSPDPGIVKPRACVKEACIVHTYHSMNRASFIKRLRQLLALLLL
jgi:hypothetical protein